MQESATHSQNRLQLRLATERLRTVRCVMWSIAALMCVVSVLLIALMVHYYEQGNADAAERFGTVLTAMFPSLATVMVAVSAVITRR